MEQAAKTGGELQESAVLSILYITKSTPQKYFPTMLANPEVTNLIWSAGTLTVVPVAATCALVAPAGPRALKRRGRKKTPVQSSSDPPDSNATNRALRQN